MIGASSGGGFFLLIIVAFAFLWFVLVRPQKRRQVEQQRMLNDLQPGDDVVTAGGIYGEITRIEEDGDVMLRIAPQLEVKVARRAIGGKLEKSEQENPPEEQEEQDEGATLSGP
jgi:preprotein translocase subunit YajC